MISAHGSKCVGDTAALKQDGTWGGNGVHVAHSITEAAQELTHMLRPTPWTVVCKRMVVDRDPLALWNKKHGNPVVTLQEFIPGSTGEPHDGLLEGTSAGRRDGRGVVVARSDGSGDGGAADRPL